MESLNAVSLLAGINPAVIALLAAWTLVIKGFALWRAARLGQKWWFVIMLLVNTLGILELIYLFVITRGYKVEVVEK